MKKVLILGGSGLISIRSGKFPLELRLTNEAVINLITVSLPENSDQV